MLDENAIGLIQQFIATVNQWIAFNNGHKQFSDQYMEPHIPGLARTLKRNIEPQAFLDMNRHFHGQKDTLRKEVQSLVPTMVQLAARYGVPGGAFLLPDLMEAGAAARRLLDAVVAKSQQPGPPAGEPARAAVLTEIESRVLRRIAESTVLLKGPDAYADVGERSGKVALQNLENTGMIHRPKGKKTGYAATDLGRQRATQMRTVGAP